MVLESCAKGTGCLGFVAIKTGDVAETNDQEIMENGYRR
jgi:hypothetical protein